ncbi:MAG: hypothetical protein ACRYG8_02960 [Janthinobacterium lividum]
MQPLVTPVLQAGVLPDRAVTELSRVLPIWTAELENDGKHLQERLPGSAEQTATGIREMHESHVEASGNPPTLRRILARHGGGAGRGAEGTGGRGRHPTAPPGGYRSTQPPSRPGSCWAALSLSPEEEMGVEDLLDRQTMDREHQRRRGDGADPRGC